MLKKVQAICVCLVFGASLVAFGATSTRGNLSAAEIVEKNVAARGGLQAWRAVQSLSYQGKLGAGGNQRATLAVPAGPNEKSLEHLPQRPAEEAMLPFLLEVQRGRKMRLELQFRGEKAVQVYDGVHGWELWPYLNRLEVEDYSADELKKASMESDLDGPLVDYVAKGSRVELEGVEKVADHDTYKLKVTEKSGRSLHVWVDAQTFLEDKIEGQPRRLDGTDHSVEVYYGDYHTVNGLKIPFLLETRVLSVGRNALGMRDTPVPPEKIIIDSVTVNPKLDASRFSRPTVQIASKAKTRPSM